MFSGFGRDRERHPLDDLEPEALETAVLRGVVRHQPHRRDAEVDEDLGADAVLAAVGREARARGWRRRCRGPCPAGCRRGACGRCRCRGPRGRAGTRPRRCPRRRCFSMRGVELRPAVAAQRPEHVAGEALAVHAHEHVVACPARRPARTRGARSPSSSDSKATQVKSPHSVGMRASATRRTSFSRAAPVADQVGDRDQSAGRARRRSARGRAAAPSCRRRSRSRTARRPGSRPGEPGQVDRRLGVAGALEHAALAVAQREDVARAERGRRACVAGSMRP